MKINNWCLFNAVLKFPLVEQGCIEQGASDFEDVEEKDVTSVRYVNQLVLHMGDMGLAQKVNALITEFLFNVFPTTMEYPDSAQNITHMTDMMETSLDLCSVSIPYELLCLLKEASGARPDLFWVPSKPTTTLEGKHMEFVSEWLIPDYLSIDSRAVRVEPAFSELSLSSNADAGVVEVDLCSRAAFLFPEHVDRRDRIPQITTLDSGFQRFLGFMTKPKMQIHLRSAEEASGVDQRRLYLTE